MIYECNGQKIIFIHIPRTGGTSIDLMLQRNWGFVPQEVRALYPVPAHHMTYNELQRSIRKADPDEAMDMEDYFSFTFVRNPYARSVSQWRAHHEQNDDLDFKSWLFTIEKQLEDDPYACDAHLRPQTDFVSAHINRIGRVENFIGDFCSILSDMGVYVEPHLLVQTAPEEQQASDLQNRNRDYYKWYDDETKEVILKMYHSDLSQFKYRFVAND